MNANFYLPALLAQVADRLPNDFLGLDQEQRFVVLIIALGCATAVLLGLAGIVSTVIGSVHRRRAEMSLKREMIERGMTADEIVKVMGASPLKDGIQRMLASCGKEK